MSGLGRKRTGTIIRDVEGSEIKDALFGAPVPGSGEVRVLDLPQSQKSDSGEENDPRNLALLVRPERYQERIARQQASLGEQADQLAQEEQRLKEIGVSLEAREEEIAGRERELEALVLSAVEERVEKLSDERLAEGRARLVASVTQLEAVAHGLLDQARLDLLELAIKIAGRIIGAELEARPQVLVGLIRSALEAAAPSGQVVLRLHPKDHAILSKRGPKVLGRLPAGIQIQLAADEAVDRGGVVIASDAGRVDATIAKRLQRVGAQLAELAES